MGKEGRKGGGEGEVRKWMERMGEWNIPPFLYRRKPLKCFSLWCVAIPIVWFTLVFTPWAKRNCW
jgi:hypothetical protein